MGYDGSTGFGGTGRNGSTGFYGTDLFWGVWPRPVLDPAGRRVRTGRVGSKGGTSRVGWNESAGPFFF
jgi:hypothetical protein